MKKIYIILILILANVGLFSQSIKLVRTDVDSTRANFVTATYMFGFDVVVNDLENCNNASFQLKFNNAKYVKFSGAKLNDFADSGQIFIYEYADAGSDEVFLSIGAFSGQPLSNNGHKNPNLVHLEFVVTPTAPNNERVTFTFLNAYGSTYKDGVGNKVLLASTPSLYDIHGFVDVWPGDTDNNLNVDNVDWTTVYENLKFKERFPGYRSFKRENATTNWSAQRSLVWDVEKATYADCDGDGEVSVTDGLVVLLNLSTTNTVPIIKKKDEVLSSNLIPVSIEFFREYRGIYGQIKADEEITRIIPGELFTNSDAMFHVEHNVAEFVLGNFSKDEFVKKSGVAFYIETKSNDINIQQLRGISTTNTLFNLKHVALDIETDDDFSVINTLNGLRINSDLKVNSTNLFDINGRLINSTANSKEINVDLISGYYTLIINFDNKTIKYPLIISK